MLGIMIDRLQIQFGALAPPIARQLLAAGLTANKRLVAQWQREVDALMLLAARGLANPDAIQAGRVMVAKRIVLEVAGPRS